MNWINTKDQVPDYYKVVIVFDGCNIYYEYHRLSNGEDEYYGNTNNDFIIYEVTHWMPLPEKPKS